ncbi:hypothetical protein ESCNG_2020002 [Neisseria gonorrhoeae]|nr:hypothetical protein ESCNG_2020002 [Neisseria gonorrhoeae]
MVGCCGSRGGSGLGRMALSEARAAGFLYYGNGQARRHQPDGFRDGRDFAVQPGIGRRAGFGAD